jgi:hypothetical protein
VRQKGKAERSDALYVSVTHTSISIYPRPYPITTRDSALHGAWQRHARDEPELALQILVAFERLLRHEETRASLLLLLADPAVVEDLAAAVGYAGNAAVRAAARACVALLVEADRRAEEGGEEEQADGNEGGLDGNCMSNVLMMMMMMMMMILPSGVAKNKHSTMYIHRAGRAPSSPALRGAQPRMARNVWLRRSCVLVLKKEQKRKEKTDCHWSMFCILCYPHPHTFFCAVRILRQNPGMACRNHTHTHTHTHTQRNNTKKIAARVKSLLMYRLRGRPTPPRPSFILLFLLSPHIPTFGFCYLNGGRRDGGARMHTQKGMHVVVCIKGPTQPPNPPPPTHGAYPQVLPHSQHT